MPANTRIPAFRLGFARRARSVGPRLKIVVSRVRVPVSPSGSRCKLACFQIALAIQPVRLGRRAVVVGPLLGPNLANSAC